MDGIDSKQSISLMLGDTNHVMQYDANFISIDAKKQSGEIISVDLHGLKMNIVELKDLGSKLHELTGKDPSLFLAWCDKVGNTWIDVPLYSAGNATAPDGHKIYAFDVNRTYDDTQPWHISLLI